MPPTRDTGGDMDYGALGQPVTNAVLKRFAVRGKPSEQQLPIDPASGFSVSGLPERVGMAPVKKYPDQGPDEVFERGRPTWLPASARVAMLNSNDPDNADMSVRQAIRDTYGKPTGIFDIVRRNGTLPNGRFKPWLAAATLPTSGIQSLYNPVYNATNQYYSGMERGDERGAVEDYITNSATAGSNAFALTGAPSVLKSVGKSVSQIPSELRTTVDRARAIYSATRAGAGAGKLNAALNTANAAARSGVALAKGSAGTTLKTGLQGSYLVPQLQGVAPQAGHLGTTLARADYRHGLPEAIGTVWSGMGNRAVPALTAPVLMGTAAANAAVDNGLPSALLRLARSLQLPRAAL